MSSLKDLASLIMIPSLVKDGRLDTVKPLGNSIIHPDATGNNDGTDGSTPAEGNFTFSRGSNLAATRVDVNGLIEKGRENLYTQSNNFSHSDWTPRAGVFTKGVSDPNGGNEAWSWTATNTDPYLYQAIGTSGVFTLSIYAKGVGSTIGKVLELRNGSTTQNFTLTSEWQRFELYAAAGGSNIGFEFGNPATANDVVHIYAAQLEQGLVATDYIETGASTAQSGILEDLPRLDYSGGASCPSLLLEPQRSNKFLFSEYYGSGALGIYQTGTNTHSVTNNYAVSPEGVQNAIRFVADITSVGDRVVLRDGVSCGGGNHTLTFYAKSNTSDTYTMKMHFDGSGKKQIEVTPEWQRFEYGESANATCNAGIECSSASGYSPSVDISVYGFQLEENLYPTSYIPTYGSAVTRSSESQATDYGVLGGGQVGSIFLEFERFAIDTSWTGAFTQLVSSGGSEEIRLHFDAPSAQVRWRDANNSYLDIGGAISTPSNSRIKTILTSDGNTIKVFANGSKIGNDYTIVNPLEFDKLVNLQRGAMNLYSEMYFPTALTDSECIALTS